MTTALRRWTLLWILAGSLAAQEPPRRLREDVQRAIDRGVDWILSHGEGDELRFDEGHDGHRALALYALLKSGVSPTHPRIVRAFDELRGRRQQTYTAACIALALTAGRPEGWRDWLAELTGDLVDWQEQGAWGYPSGEDLSNTQYASLALFAAARTGIEVPLDVWEDLSDAVHDYRGSDGGYSYHRNGTSYGSMTAAGVGTLAICRERLSYGGGLPADLDALLSKDIEDGLAWLGRHFAVDENPGSQGWLYYYLYGLERVGALCGVGSIGGHDWYAEGAGYLVGTQAEDGSWRDGGGTLTSTCFALLFLRRATAPLSRRPPATASLDVYGRDDPQLDVSLRAAGDTPLELWIARFGSAVVDELAWPGEDALRVARVEYTADGETIGVVPGQLERPAVDTYFELEHRFDEPGWYDIEVVVDVLAPPRSSGGGEIRTRVVQLRSPGFRVFVRDVDPAWMRALKAWIAESEGPRTDSSVRASSSFEGLDPWSGQHVTSDPRLAFDHDAETAWWSRPDDDEPWLRRTFEDEVLADTVVLCHARTRFAEPADFGRAGRVELILDRKQRHTVHLGPGVHAPTVFELPEPIAIRTLELRLHGLTRGRIVDGVGFTEVLLLARGRDQPSGSE